MAFSKSHLFDPSDQMTSAFAKALAHPVRVDIIRFLHEIESSTVENLCHKYPLAKSTISQHLEILRKAQLITFKEDYPFIIYSLNRKNFDLLRIKLLDYCRGF